MKIKCFDIPCGIYITGLESFEMNDDIADTNDNLYKALLKHRQNSYHSQESLAGSVKSVFETNALRKVRAEEASSVVTSSTHYLNNSR